MAEIHPAEKKVCQELGSLVAELRKIDGRGLRPIGEGIGRSKTWLDDLEKGKLLPENISKQPINVFLEIIRCRDVKQKEKFEELKLELLNVYDHLQIIVAKRELEILLKQVDYYRQEIEKLEKRPRKAT